MTFTCRDSEDKIEALASGELIADAAMSAHLAGCPRCQAQLGLARRIERLLEEPPRPAPPGFVAAIERRLRRDWWKAEQFIDITFNLAIVGGLGAVLIGIWLLLEFSGLVVVTSDASSVFVSGLRSAVAGLSPRLPTYALAFLLVLTAMTVWWWVDEDEER